ncbi:hypothetical protein [Bremerella sp.]|uniref:glycosyltransferase family 39 protein n=1 Tax=Bremerella sp. TaxID=2795602 RepID=UPI00391CEA60
MPLRSNVSTAESKETFENDIHSEGVVSSAGGVAWSVWDGLVIGALALVALLFRVPYLSSRSIWYDESCSWQTSQFSYFGIVEALCRDVHMPLYYFLLKAWMSVVGDSAFALRGLSIFLGIVTVVAMYGVAKECCRILNAVVDADDWWYLPVATGILIAVSAFQINASIEARMYGLGTALSALSAWALLRIITDPRQIGPWIAWVSLCIMLTYTHHHCLFMVASQFLVLMGAWTFQNDGIVEPKLKLSHSLLAGLIILLAYLPGAMMLWIQIRRVRQNYWTEPLSFELVNRTFAEFVSPLMRDSRFEAWVGGLCLGVLITSAIIVLIRPRLPGMVAMTLGGLPLMAAGAVTIAITPVWEGRFFRFPQIFLCLLIAIAIFKLTRRARDRVILTALLVTGVSVASGSFWLEREIDQRPGMKGVIENIVSRGEPETLIVSTSNIHCYPAKYYAPESVKVRIFRSATDEFWGDYVIRENDIISDEEIQQAANRGFWVLSHSPIPDNAEELRGFVVDEEFREHYDIGVPDWEIYASRVRKLSVPMDQTH